MRQHARTDIELAVRTGNKPAALTEILQTISDCGINLLAYCTYRDRQDLVALLLTSDPARAKQALSAKGFDCRANAVVVVGAADEVGAVARLGASLAGAGIGILYSYASSSGGNNFCAVFKTVNDPAALAVLTADRRDSAAA